ncbi:4-diphosphocytidyl-2-C-methyl-D-erythritol kinase [Succinivibrio dextrinosolvens]|uniref:4-(cytidine 5'-diphospho)-2-C-methyl-D-erythritol kinase n=1 Tax=Succinivibrio dextrinosolvens TaxID=83771 RepID=UPI0008E24DD4|nr:4-(cytidine 5'-diphospho)-2-C-methyl-D-erythritol kinase [Succinivibrio dextrinosolvens]SFS90137.1 4-diphosphocytidyl-2-C-methyl-D-erythritol kinase [Succinivibrio dextrinosolvens]
MKYNFLSPCKLNLFLYITGKREDSYHNLQTLFVVLDYGDMMHFETTDEGKIELTTDFGFDEKKNLIYRAAKLLQDKTGCSLGATISIDKILPQGGGLGGGSANAATTLLVLNKLWKLNLSEEELIEMGAGLGADVPIFIKGTTCFAEGIGEKLVEVDYPQKYYLVVTPDCSVPTAKLFSSDKLKKDSPSRTYEELLEVPFENCFTPVVISEYPQVEELLKELSVYGKSYMSGSGSSCFVEFDDELSAQKALSQFKQSGYKCFVARSVKQSSVLQELKELR